MFFLFKKNSFPFLNYFFTHSARSALDRRGLGLVECVIGVAVFVIVAVSVYQTYSKIFDLVRLSRTKLLAVALANEQFEIIRNLPYADVGIMGGLPSGKIPRLQTLLRNKISFTVTTTIRNIDDPFDGLLGGSPNDLSPADYKLVEVEINCGLCKNFQPIRFTSTAAPKNLETAAANGALFVKVFDANGQPVSGANVHIENRQIIPSIIIDDVTNISGLLQLVDVPPGAEAYEITVSKSGYSSEKTYATGSLENPNPVKPNATVVEQQITQINFAIDKTGVFSISSVTETCLPSPNTEFTLSSAKLVGTNPDKPKHQASYTTSGAGQKTISDLEWDSYNFVVNNADYELRGVSPSFPLALAPGAAQNLQLVVGARNPNSLLVIVKDSSTGLPLSGSLVTLERKVGDTYQNSFTTGRGFLRQTDWSGGGGQAEFLDETKYYTADGNIETGESAGELRLKKVFDEYAPAGTLVSSTFDTGSPSNFHQISWQPSDQPLPAGSDSVRLQIAANNDQETWEFVGPDGTAGSFYTSSDSNINPVHNGSRYLRYKIFLRTADVSFTPNVADVALTFTSSCVPPGQVLFGGLAAGDADDDEYTLTVSRDGYQTFVETFFISEGGNRREVNLVTE